MHKGVYDKRAVPTRRPAVELINQLGTTVWVAKIISKYSPRSRQFGLNFFYLNMRKFEEFAILVLIRHAGHFVGRLTVARGYII